MCKKAYNILWGSVKLFSCTWPAPWLAAEAPL